MTMKEMLTKLAEGGYVISAGSTSNCESSYEVAAVVETISGKLIQIIVTNFMGRKAVTPITVYARDGRFVAEGNFGTPQIVGTEVDPTDLSKVLIAGLHKFNIDVLPAESCEWSSLERIERFITRDGVEVELA